MNNPRFNFLFTRRPAISYVSPALCEVVFSSSGFAAIILPPFGPQSKPSGPVWGGVGKTTFSWSAYPDAICYNVYKRDQFGDWQLVSECAPDPVYDSGVDGGEFRYTVITTEGESDPSDSVIIPGGGGGTCDVTFNSPPDLFTDGVIGDELIFDFNVTTAAPGETYQWFKDDLPLLGETGESLTINPVACGDAGIYKLLVTPADAECPSVMSAETTLTAVCAECAATNIDLSPAPTPLDLVTLVNRGDYIPTITSDGSGSGSNIFTSMGSFSDGYYVAQYLGGTWKTTMTPVPGPQCLGTDGFTKYGMVFTGMEYKNATIPNNLFYYDFGDVPLEDTPGAVEDDVTFGDPLPIFVSSIVHHSGGEMRLIGANVAIFDSYQIAGCATVVTEQNAPPVTYRLLEAVLNPLPDRVRIKNYSTDFLAPLQICPACEDRAGVEWDGTFPLRLYYPSSVSPPEATLQYSPNVNGATASIKGKVFSGSQATIFLSELEDSTPCWFITIQCKLPGGASSNVLWWGVKTVGATPEGVYTPIAGTCNCSACPACLEIESY